VAKGIAKDLGVEVWREGRGVEAGGVIVCRVGVKGESSRDRQGSLEVFKGEMERRERRGEVGWGEEDEMNGGGQGEGEGREGKSSKDEEYRANTFRVMVATPGSAARGLDVVDCHTVVNLVLPPNAEEYVHRGGRAGRGGKKGEVANVVGKGEEFRVGRLGNELGIEIECVGRMQDKE